MRKVKIRPWPFKEDEEVELFWLCSPYLNQEQNWMLKAAFRDVNNTIKEIDLPWGTLPNLTIGEFYRNGLPNETKKSGMIEEVDVSGLNSYEICNSFDMPYDLYYLYKNSLYGRQKVCRFNVDDRVFYIPCIEVIRSFLTPSKVLAYHLLKSNGLNSLIENLSFPSEKTASINVSCDFPLKLTNEDNIMHLLWLLTNKYARITWEYVYKTLYRKANYNSYNNIQEALSIGLPIEARPPYMEKAKWTFRGITVKNCTLIFEISSITGLHLPYSFIYYNHPSFNKTRKVSEERTAKRVGKKEEIDIKLDESDEPTASNSNVRTIDNAKLRFGFSNIHILQKTFQGNRFQKTGKHQGDNLIEGGNVKESITVGTQDWAYGGSVNPLEFRLLEIEKTTSTMGLEGFIKTMKFINGKYNELRIQLNVVLLPAGKGFSYYPSGHRRTCAIVKVITKDQLTRYILEVGRADNWSISTLLVYPLSVKQDDTQVEKLMARILNDLVNNNGHWDKASMYRKKDYKFDMMKHVSNQSVRRWGSRFLSKMM